jgi:hypothetical protein
LYLLKSEFFRSFKSKITIGWIRSTRRRPERRPQSKEVSLKTVAALVAVAAGFAASHANAQVVAQAPSTVPTTAVVGSTAWPGYYSGGSTVNESWARGKAELMRAAGEQDLNSSLAARNWEVARKAAIDNWAYQIRTKNEVRDERLARDKAEHPPLSPTQQQYLTRIRDPKRLSPSQLTADGVIHWPSVLKTEEFEAARTQLDTLFADRAQGSTAADEVTRKIDAAAIEMTKALEQTTSTIPAMERVNAKNFLASLRFEAHRRPAAGEEQVAAATK